MFHAAPVYAGGSFFSGATLQACGGAKNIGRHSGVR